MRAAQRPILRACPAGVDTGLEYGHAAWSIVLILIADQRERTPGALTPSAPPQQRIPAAIRTTDLHRLHKLYGGGAFAQVGLVGHASRHLHITLPHPPSHPT